MTIKKVILLVMVFTLVTTTALAYNFANGSGTQTDPYQIATFADLNGLSLDSSVWDCSFVQTADIDATESIALNNGSGFSPIGIGVTSSFHGSYDGKEFTISNLYINRPNTDYISLFGRIESAVILNVRVINNDITGGQRVGGIVGHAHYSTVIDNCFATGNILGVGTDYAGGLVGSVVDSSISNSSAISYVVGYNHVGGLVGYSSGPIYNCYATGQASGIVKVGGLIGISYHSTINNSYATGSAFGSSSVGGLAGNLYNSSASNCYSTGHVAASTTSYIGGLVGEGFMGTVANSYWNNETSGQTQSSGGIGKTTQEMKDISTYLDAGWDLNSTWLVNSHVNSGYPFLLNNVYSKLSIPNNSTNVSLTPTISLEIIDAFLNYELYFGETPNPETNLISSGSINNPISYTFTNPLEYSTGYYWTLKLYDEDGASVALNFNFTTQLLFTGSGTEADPYQISNLNELIFLSEHEEFWDKYFIQISDIDASSTSDLNGTAGFNPIGAPIAPFTGSYNGNGYLISNISINRQTSDYMALFGYIDGATISNVSLVDCEIKGGDYTACLVGLATNYSLIKNSFSTGYLRSRGAHAGGLVGYTYISTIYNSYSTSAVYGIGAFLGGLVGKSTNSSVINCFWDTDKSGLDSSAGGIGKRSILMTNIYTFMNAGWDFVMEDENGSEDIWNIHSNVNNGYPHLITQEQFIDPELPKFALYSYPNDGASNMATSDKLYWQPDFLGNCTGYKVYIAPEQYYPPADFVIPQYCDTTTSCLYSQFNEYTTYYWQVVPYNANGDALDCPIWSFTTGSHTLLSYGDGDSAYKDIPLNYKTQRSYSQSIYLKSELDFLLGQCEFNSATNTIDNIAFYLTDDFNISGANQWKVYLGHTDKTEFTNNHDWLFASQGLTEVADITLNDRLGAGWLNVEFTTPFAYNNSDNLIVGLLEYGPGIVENPAYFYTVETDDNRSLTYGHNSILPNTNTSYDGVVSTCIPKINFSFKETILQGRILNSQNQPIANANVHVSESYTVLSNELGEFSVSSLAPGSHQITVSAPWYETLIIPFKILEGQDNYLEVTLLEDLLPANNATATLAEDLSNVCVEWTAPTLSQEEIKSKQISQEVNKKTTRTLQPIVHYNLYRLLLGNEDHQGNWVGIASQLTSLTFSDSLFLDLDLGDYTWAVQAVYDNNRVAPATYSNMIAKEAILESSISTLDFGLIQLSDESDYQEVIITNTGNGNLTINNINCSNSAFNLSYDELDLCIEPNTSFPLQVQFAPNYPGNYVEELIINNNSVNEPNYLISLSGSCAGLIPVAPENIQITMIGNNANLTWDAVTDDLNQNRVTINYLISCKEEEPSIEDDYLAIGTTANLTFVHNTEDVESKTMFYRVKALVNFDATTLSSINRLLSERGEVSQKEIESFIKKNTSKEIE
jgi:hypothetical protein